MIQQFNRFVLEEMAVEGNSPSNPIIAPGMSIADEGSPPSPVTQMFGIQSETIIECGLCHVVTKRTGMTHLVDLVYPRKVSFQCFTSAPRADGTWVLTLDM